MTESIPASQRRLEGQTCIVTGAASGIGRSIACLFAAQGAQVVVADISETVLEGGEPTVAAIQAAGGQPRSSRRMSPMWRPSKGSSPRRWASAGST